MIVTKNSFTTTKKPHNMIEITRADAYLLLASLSALKLKLVPNTVAWQDAKSLQERINDLFDGELEQCN
jgi:hypothetical protein